MKIGIMPPLSRFTAVRIVVVATMAAVAVCPALAEEEALIALLAPRTEAVEQPEQRELRIEKAVYGDLPDGAQRDVTALVAGHVRDGALVLQVANSLFGDPAQGVVKQLQVTYVLGDQRRTATVGENQELRLGHVRDGVAGWREQFDACRRLRRVGTERAVPVLAALLQDDSLFDAALDALEALPFAEVDAALREALDQTQGRKRIGVMQALGARRDPQAVPALVAALQDPDPGAVAAAMAALGRIGTPQAARALMATRERVDEALRHALAEGLLAAGSRLIEDGHLALAGRIGLELSTAAWPGHVRLAGFQIQVQADRAKAFPLLLEALQGNDPILRGLAASLITETDEETAFRRYAAALGDLPVAGQLALIHALADTGRIAGRPVVIQGLRSPDATVRVAAAEALGHLGSGEEVPHLVALVRSEDNALAEAARESLVRMNDPEVTTRLVHAVTDGDPEVCAVLLQVLARRGSERVMPILLSALEDGHGAMRRAALQALADRGTAEHAPALLSALMTARDDAERQAAGRCLAAFSARFGAAILPALREALPLAGPQDGAVMLVALPRIGGAEALALALPMLASEETALQEAAERVLVGWPDLAAAPHLLALADADQAERRTAALRGYVRLARTEPSAEQRARMLAAAMEKARRPEEQWPILGTWGTVHTEAALARLTPHLQDEATRNEAASAILAVAREVIKQDAAQKAGAVDALEQVSAHLGDQPLGLQARELLSANAE